MSHKFNGTWSYFDLSRAPFPGGSPQQSSDFRLYIDDAGHFDLARSRVDGRTIRTATVQGEEYFDIEASDGRLYRGFFVKEDVCDNGSVIVMAGKVRQPMRKASKSKGGKEVEAAQNEGDWVITKP